MSAKKQTPTTSPQSSRNSISEAERKRAEEALRAKHELFQKTFNISPLSSVLTKLAERTIIEVNPAFWDGTGYPRGLKGEQIPLSARLFSVVDVWDALRSDRPYREGWLEEQVLVYIRAQAGTQFDPKAVGLFFQMMEK